MKRKIQTFLVLLAGMAVTFVFMEAFCRLGSIWQPNRQYIHPRLGLLSKPGSRFLYFSEGMTMNTINKNGYLGSSYPKRKPEDSIRIVLLGASNIAGSGVTSSHTLAHLLKNQLALLIGRKVEILNFSRFGANLQHLYVRYIKWARRYEADYYLVFVGAYTLGKEGQTGEPSCLLEEGQLKIQYPLPGKRPRFSIKNTVAYQAVRRLYRFFWVNFTFPTLWQGNRPFVKKVFAPSRKAVVYRENKSLFPVNAAILRELLRNQPEGAGRVILVVKDEIPSSYHSLVHAFGSDWIDLHAFAEKLRALGWDLNYWKATGLHGHWNPRGHEFYANYLARQLAMRVAECQIRPGGD